MQTKNKTPNLEKEYDRGVKTRVYVIKTELLPQTSDAYESVGEMIVFTPARDGVRKVVIYTNRELNEGEIDLRVRWFLGGHAACTRCGCRYDNSRYVGVVATRNGTFYHSVVCGNCNTGVVYSAAVVG
jgi:hypothetical protein